MPPRARSSRAWACRSTWSRPRPAGTRTRRSSGAPPRTWRSSDRRAWSRSATCRSSRQCRSARSWFRSCHKHDMIRAPVGRYIRYWYTYRTAVAVLIAVVLSGAIYWLYTQQVACDSHAGCIVNLSVHPEDRFVDQQVDPGTERRHRRRRQRQREQDRRVPGAAQIATRQVLLNLEDLRSSSCSPSTWVSPTRADPKTDRPFAKALANSTVPVVLSYERTQPPDSTQVAERQGGPDRDRSDSAQSVSLRQDANPDPKRRHARSRIRTWLWPRQTWFVDADGVLRTIPMFVQPGVLQRRNVQTPAIDPLELCGLPSFSPGQGLSDRSRNCKSRRGPPRSVARWTDASSTGQDRH